MRTTPTIPVRIRLGDQGLVEIGGQDITAHVDYLGIEAGTDRVHASVLIRLMSDDISIDGVGEVSRMRDDRVVDYAGAAEIIRSFDPAELKAEALKSGGLGGLDVVASSFGLLADRVEKMGAG
jgi:hypothetical protein